MAKCKECIHYESCSDFSKIINSAVDVEKGCEHFKNSNDFVEVVHGCTVPAEQPKKVLLDRKCGICDSLMLSTDAYCPNCGAMMGLEVHNDSADI